MVVYREARPDPGLSLDCGTSSRATRLRRDGNGSPDTGEFIPSFNLQKRPVIACLSNVENLSYRRCRYHAIFGSRSSMQSGVVTTRADSRWANPRRFGMSTDIPPRWKPGGRIGVSLFYLARLSLMIRVAR